MFKLICILILSAASLSIARSAPRDATTPSLPSVVPAHVSRHPVIVHIAFRDQTITISAGPRGPLFSLTRRADGKVIFADTDEPTFARLRPDLYRQFRGPMNAQNDSRPTAASDPPLMLDASVN